MSLTVTVGNLIMDKAKVTTKEVAANKASNSENIDEILEKVTTVDNTCSFTKCKNRTKDIAIHCKYCNKRYCTTHGLPEIHGCGEAVKRDEKRKFLHPDTKLSNEKHSQAQTKLNMKLKQMQLERKSKQGFSNKGKKN
ncbi:hypothetical protein NQ314_000850 [Rhamnusium bicolor]|uniref:AN1-type domain-containing protein n=1 Tax=Rhamnusium bicolor TaxID=1586634 RepID=A0AAV8ZU41_9CUCU|nr:hypothetical protein NQ314_000850 [Rhamnusium bicolor]